MKVLVPSTAGFCFGVERALRMLDDAIKRASEEGRKVFSLGEIIHNEAVVNTYKARGVIFVRRLEELDEADEGDYVLVRTHGVPKELMEKLQNMKLQVLDGTCPYVKKIHRIVEDAERRGRKVIIFGKFDHPEIIGTRSYAPNSVVISSPEGLDELDLAPSEELTVVSQTTELERRYDSLVKRLKELFHKVEVHNTICYVTQRNQRIASQVADMSDVIVVVGGRNSSNTRKLYEISASKGKPTYHVTFPDELEREWFSGAETVGLLSGASTPKSAILEVAKRLSRWYPLEVLMVDVSGNLMSSDLSYLGSDLSVTA